MIKITNLTNSPYELEGGNIIAALGSFIGNFANDYIELLKQLPNFKVEFEEIDLRLKAESLGIKVDGRWSEDRLRSEIEKAS